MLFRTYAESWIDREEQYLKASTAQVYRRTIRRLIASFGGCELGAIHWREVRDWLRSLNLTERSTSNVLSIFRTVLAGAVEDELLDDNPLDGKKPRLKDRRPQRDRLDPFTAEERAALLGGCETDSERNMLQFLMWTGIRISEMLALDWSDVSGDSVLIRGALTQAARTIERPKTNASTRCVRLLRPAKSALDKQRAQTRLGGGAVFTNPRTGRRWTGDAVIRRVFKDVCARAGVRYRHPYMLRHTYASMMLTAGEDIGWISTQMGHTTTALTERVYARYIQGDRQESGSRAERFWAC